MLRWSPGTDAELTEVLIAGVRMAVPILLAGAIGQFAAGLAAAFGALVVGRIATGSNLGAQARNIATALVPAGVAAIAAAVVAGHGGLTDAVLVVLAFVAAMVGGYSRFLAGATTRFILVLVIAAAVLDGVGDRAGFLVLMGAGAAWTALLNVAFGALLRAAGRVESGAHAAAPRQATASQKFRRWRQSLAAAAGWQYALRLGSCLVVAGALRSLWPDHHLHWIALTVALLSQRRPETVSVKTTQRALGTALGVVAASTLLAFRPSAWGLVAGIGLLAAMRPFFRDRNYLVYSAIMTPLIIMIMDAGRPPDGRVLLDRLTATLAGAALVIAANLIARRLLRAGEG
ncbi:MAG: FUSC family protein [Burkholderiales bacterium]